MSIVQVHQVPAHRSCRWCHEMPCEHGASSHAWKPATTSGRASHAADHPHPPVGLHPHQLQQLPWKQAVLHPMRAWGASRRALLLLPQRRTWCCVGARREQDTSKAAPEAQNKHDHTHTNAHGKWWVRAARRTERRLEERAGGPKQRARTPHEQPRPAPPYHNPCAHNAATTRAAAHYVH